jgi:hypothetical protein
MLTLLLLALTAHAADHASDVILTNDVAPNTGDLTLTLTFESRFPLTRAQHNTVRAAAVTAGGMSNVTAAYAAIRGELDTIRDGADVWLDRWSTGVDGTETTRIRAAVVWQFVSRGEVPAAPQP